MRSSSLNFTALISSLAGATPSISISRQESPKCNPAFPDVPVLIGNSQFLGLSNGVKDGSGLIKVVEGLPNGRFRFQKDDSYSPPQYTFSAFDDESLAVGLRVNQSLYLTKADRYDPKQRFLIECDFDCGTSFLFGDSCFITSVATRKCPQVGNRKNEAGLPAAGNPGDAVTLQDCVRSDGQRFNFFLDTNPQPSSSPAWPHQSASEVWPHQSSKPAWPHQSSAPPWLHESSAPVWQHGSPSAPAWPHQSEAPALHSSAPTWRHEPVPQAATTWPHQSPTAQTGTPGAEICNPNFEGRSVRVANSALSWGARQFANDENLVANFDFNSRMEVVFQQTGSQNVAYTAKSLNGSNLIVGARANGSVYLLTDDEESRSNQRWLIECARDCLPGASVAPDSLTADECRIRFESNGKCVQVGDSSLNKAGDPIFLADCNGGFEQLFNFQTSPFPVNGGIQAFSGSTKTNLAASDSQLGPMTGDLKKLIKNSYIVIGLLGAVLLAFFVMLASLSFKNRADKRRYTPIAKGDIEAFTASRPFRQY